MNERVMQRKWFVVLAVVAGLCGLGLAACRRASVFPAPSPVASPSVRETFVPPTSTVQPPPATVPVPSAGITLTWWTPESFSPAANGLSGELLAGQIADFVVAYPDIGVRPVLKAPYGKGGILDFLRTARAAAPGVLPDLVTIDTTELPAAVQYGLLQPLDNLLSSELRDDLFPFAVSVGQFGRQWLAVQFQADLEHLVYRTAELPRPPSTWAELLAGKARYIFPAAGREGVVNDATLIQYLSAGGKVDPTTHQLTLEEQPLRELLNFYRQGRLRKVIPAQVLTLDSIEACWAAYLSGTEATMSNALASRYLAERALLRDTGFAPLPSRDGRVATVTRGWALAIVTTDPARQKAAARFIEWLLLPEHNAAWTQAAGRLPARRSALAVWGTEDDYYIFLRWQLESAAFRPGGSSYMDTGTRLQRAVSDVLAGQATPDEAVKKALEPIGP